MHNPKLYPVLGLVLYMSTAIGCDSAKFSGIDGSKPQPAETTPPPVPSEKSKIETFSIEHQRSPIDMIWAVDTSGSMAEEIRQVQLNLTNFLQSVQSQTDLKFVLLGSRSPSRYSAYSVTLPTGLSTASQQIDVPIGSTNALGYMASMICPSGMSQDRKTCGQTISVNTRDGYLENSIAIQSAAGSLVNSLRKDAKPIFVIVTDDNALGVDESNFLSLIQPHMGTQTPTIYAFSGQSGASRCNIARSGAAYDQLAKQTGGQTFDICESNWQSNFTTLSNNVKNIANSRFVLKTANIQSLGFVKLDGTTLSQSQYSFSGSTLEIKSGVLTDSSKTLEVEVRN